MCRRAMERQRRRPPRRTAPGGTARRGEGRPQLTRSPGASSASSSGSSTGAATTGRGRSIGTSSGSTSSSSPSGASIWTPMPAVHRQPGAGRDEPTHDDVLLEAAQVVDLAADRRLGEHLGRLLERRRRDERLGRERRLRDAEEQRLADRRRLPARRSRARSPPRTMCFSTCSSTRKFGVADVLDADAAQHLADDDLDVLVVDPHALEAVDLLDLVDQVLRELLLALAP